MKIEATIKYRPLPVVTVFGISNAGVEIVNSLFNQDIYNKINFVVASSDSWSLDRCRVNIQIRLGAILNRGIGASTSLSFGVGGVFESILNLEQFMLSVDLLFIIVGLGGGTGTTGCSVVADLARRANIFVVGIAILPFEFEGKHRKYNSIFGLELFRRLTNLIIVIPNERLLQLGLIKVEITFAFSLINRAVYGIVKGMMTVISRSGVFNTNFCDALLVLRCGGTAFVGHGEGYGYRRSVAAVRQAVLSSFLKSIIINRARALLVTFFAGDSLCLREINNAIFYLVRRINYSADLVIGYGVEAKFGRKLAVTIVGAGIDNPLFPRAVKRRNLFFRENTSFCSFTRPFVGVSVYDLKLRLMPVKLLPRNTKLKPTAYDKVLELIFLMKQRAETGYVSPGRCFREKLYQYYSSDC